MKLGLALLSLFAAGVSADVEIEVACDGVKYEHLSAKALAYSAKAVEVTYNSVHNGIDGEVMSGVAAINPFSNAASLRGPNGATLNFEAEVEECRYCGDEGVSGCPNCGDDSLAGNMLEAWEAELTAMFSKSSHASLNKAKKCTVRMIDVQGCPNCGDDQFKGCPNCSDDEFVGDIEAVSISAKCENIEFAHLPTLKAVSYVSATLQDTYNAIYQSIDGSKLDATSFDAHRVFLGAATGIRGCPNCGDDEIRGCPNCGDDALVTESNIAFTAFNIIPHNFRGCPNCGDDAFIVDVVVHNLAFTDAKKFAGCPNCGDDALAVTESPPMKAHEAWENLFEARLGQESNFKGAANCEITIKQSVAAKAQ